nr:MAG TPA: Putative HNHc nuclease [Caudoviricetes sp.]
MAALNETVRGRIAGYDERSGEVIIRAPYTDFATMCRREYKEVEIRLIDSRPLSDRQRRSCYAMIREIADWAGDDASEIKEYLKTDFWASELMDTADTMFSLSNAPMSIVAAFQRWLARFIVRHDVPCKKSLLSYVDDVDDYVYACVIHKKCAICGKPADLHHVDPIGMGRDRAEIIHEGLPVLPLCREHHQEAHSAPLSEFLGKYHINGGIPADKTICKLYRLKARST